MLYKIIAEGTGDLVQWVESDAQICVGEFVVTDVGAKKVVRVGQSESNDDTRRSYIPLWTR